MRISARGCGVDAIEGFLLIDGFAVDGALSFRSFLASTEMQAQFFPTSSPYSRSKSPRAAETRTK